MSCWIRLQIDTRETFAGDTALTDTGTYKRLSGGVHFALDPKAATCRNIVDLDRAQSLHLLEPLSPSIGRRRHSRLIYINCVHR